MSLFNLFRKKAEPQKQQTKIRVRQESEIPNHIAIIMDGNGRWAKKRMLPRIAGHKEGMNTVKKITKHASTIGVKVLTLYAFSTENWKRPKDEVSFLMQLPVDFFDTFVPELIENNIRVEVMGYIDQLPEHTRQAVENAKQKTQHNTGMILNFALNYGSRSEIIDATKAIVQQVAEDQLAIDDINDKLFGEHLMTAFLGENANPDLLIRTSGEERISNFLLWQIAYSELYFTDTAWPDFSEEMLEEAINTYQGRQRRYGGLK